jgi:uncharacterized RDD family membrane protein YckC
MKGEIRSERARLAQGERAGFVSQALAAVLDAVVILAIDYGVLFLFALVRMLVTGDKLRVPDPAPGSNAIIVFVIGVLLLSAAWSGSGRAPGMAIVGLRVVGKDGGPLSPGRAFWRALLAVPTLGLGVLWVLVSKRNKSLYDMLCGSAVVYAWRPALSESRQNQ